MDILLCKPLKMRKYVGKNADDVFRASPTPYIAFGYVYVFSGTLDSTGKCMGSSTPAANAVTSSSWSSNYEVSSVAGSWFKDVAREPPGHYLGSGIQYTQLDLSAPYISVVSTQEGEWRTPSRITTLNNAFVSWLAQDPMALSAVPKIGSCVPVSGAGAPNVHVRVSFLTSSSAVTSTTNAIYLNKATTTSAAPASKTPSAGPISTTQSIIPTTKAPVSSPSRQTSIVSQPSPSAPPSPPESQEDSKEEPDQATNSVINESPEPATQENTVDAPSPSASPSGAVVPNDGQTGETSVQVSPSDQPAAVQPNPKPPNSVAASPGTSETDNAQPGASQGAGTPSTNAPPSDDSATQNSNPGPIIISSATASAILSNAFVIESQTLEAGGSAVEISGTTYSIQPSGNTIVVNGETLPVSTPPLSPSPPAPVVVGEVTATPAPSGAFIVGDQTIAPGGSAIEVAGTTYSLQPFGNTFIVNGQALAASTLAAPATSPAPLVIGNVIVDSQSSGAYIVAGQTLNPGGSAIEVSGTTYSLQASGGSAVVNGQEVPISTVAPSASALAPILLGGVTGTPLASGAYAVAGQTISPVGPAVEISGTTYSLESSGNNIVVNGQATPISTLQPPAMPPATIVVGEVTAIPESSGAYYIVAGQTLSPEGSAIEVAGVTYSLPKSGANVVIDGATSIPRASSTLSPVAFGDVTAVPLLAGGYVVASQTLNPGGPAITVSGTAYSLPASGNTVLINGKPTTFETAAADAIITLGSQIYTAAAASAQPLVIASQTLIPGGNAITISGTTFSLPPSGTHNIVIDGQTASLAPGAAVLSVGTQQVSFTPLGSGIVIASQTLVLGGYIWQGIAASTSTLTSTLSPKLNSSSGMTRASSSRSSSGTNSASIIVSASTRPGTGSGSAEASTAAATTTGDAGRLSTGLLFRMLGGVIFVAVVVGI